MFKVTFLGSSASLPSPRHHPSCFAVTCGGVYLFDACEGIQRQMMKYGAGYGSLKAVFLSHLHADHFLGLPGLVQTLNMAARTEPLLVFGPKGTRKFVNDLLTLPHLRASFPVEVRDCEEGECLRTELFAVRCFPVEHGCPALGYAIEEPEKTRFHEEKAKKLGLQGRMFAEITEKGKLKVKNKTIKLADVTYRQAGKKIVYSGDTAPCPALSKAAEGADLLVHDSCFSRADAALAKEKKHATASDAAELACKAKVKKLALTHFSNRYENRAPLLEEARRIFKDSLAVEEGVTLAV
ncbi:MAG: ribonuclease Z [Candidatus Micrarchaeia archaeon]